jgi:hypothetical protein
MDAGEKRHQEQLRELLVEVLLEEVDERRRQPRVGASERRREWNFVKRFRNAFQTLWVIVAGTFVASLVIVMIFLVTRMLFHIDLSRYFPF